MSIPCVYAAAASGDATGGKRRRRGEDQSSAKNQRVTPPSQSNPSSGSRKSLSPLRVTPPNSTESFQMEEVESLAMDDSPLRTFEEDFFMSDQALFDMIPGFRSNSSPLITEITTANDTFGMLVHPHAKTIFRWLTSILYSMHGSPFQHHA